MSDLLMPKRVPQVGFYYHYKHDPDGAVQNYAYEVLGVGFHTEEARPGEEHFVNYRPLYESAVYRAAQELGIPCVDNRPLEMWLSDVEKEGKTIPRFTRITDLATLAELTRIRDIMY